MIEGLAGLFNPYNLQVALTIVINCLLALSVWIPLSAGQLSLGGAGFMSVGAYTAALLSLQLGWPAPLTIATGAVASAAIAYVLGYPVLRLHGVYLAIATLGFGEMVRIVALNLRITNGALGLAGIPQIADNTAFWLEEREIVPFGETRAGLDSFAWGGLLILCLLLILLAVVVYALRRRRDSRVGRALRAIQLDEMAAQAMGIDIARHKLRVFTESGFLAGLAGGLHAHLSYYIGPADFGFNRAIEMLVYVVLGGEGAIFGPLLGAGIVTALPEVLRASPNHRAILYGLILLLIVLFAPGGLLSKETYRRLVRVFGRKSRGEGESQGRSERGLPRA